MPKPARVDKPVALKVYLPTSLKARLSLILFSEVQGRVPYGGWSEFFIARAEEWLSSIPNQPEGNDNGIHSGTIDPTQPSAGEGDRGADDAG